ncbi:hypothetical protein UM876_04340 [Staphylococcus aureus]|nr:hypothetical protein UM876_04340 [Staphylococcus aureus]
MRDYLKLVNLFLISGKKIKFCFAVFLIDMVREKSVSCSKKRTIYKWGFLSSIFGIRAFSTDGKGVIFTVVKQFESLYSIYLLRQTKQLNLRNNLNY